MSVIAQAYGILERMIEATKKNDLAGYKAANRELDPLIDRLPGTIVSDLPLWGLYDVCRNACAYTFQFPDQFEQRIQDVLDEFNRIPKPE